MRRAVVGIGLVVALAGCPAPEGGARSSGSGEAATALTVQLNWLPEPQFGGIYEAERAGIFAKHGLSVTVRKGGPDVPAVQMAASGQLEVALAAADEVLRIREGGADVVALFATYQTAPQGIMTHARRSVGSLKDVFAAEGTIAVQPGLAYVEYLKQTYGEPKAQLVTYQGGIGSFLAAKDEGDFAQQCFVTSEPIAARREGVEPKTFLIAESGFNPYTSVVIARRAWVESNRETAQALVAALREGWAAYLKDPAPTNAHMRGLNPSMDAETFAQAAAAQVPLIESDETERLGLGAMTTERWAELGRQLRGLKLLEAEPDADACFVLFPPTGG